MEQIPAWPACWHVQICIPTGACRPVNIFQRNHGTGKMHLVTLEELQRQMMAAHLSTSPKCSGTLSLPYWRRSADETSFTPSTTVSPV